MIFWLTSTGILSPAVSMLSALEVLALQGHNRLAGLPNELTKLSRWASRTQGNKLGKPVKCQCPTHCTLFELKCQV